MRTTLALLATALVACSNIAYSQAVPAAPASHSQLANDQQATSIGKALRLSGLTPVHIIYIHGIGATGSGDSLALQTSICRYAKKYMSGKECVGGVQHPSVRVGTREYAEDFAHIGVSAGDASLQGAPDESYMGARIWSSSDEWHASAPFVDHYKIALRNGQSILVDEINWWPLVLPVKCKYMMPDETNLAGGDDDYFQTCSRQEANVTGVKVRSFDWLKSNNLDVAALRARGNHAVHFSRAAKVGLMDWRFSDAILGLGPLEKRFIVPGIQQLLVDCMRAAPPSPATRIYTVTHSLGSYLLFSALDGKALSNGTQPVDPKTQASFDELLKHLNATYLIANQIPLLEMAWLGTSRTRFLAFDEWGKQRRAFPPNDKHCYGTVVAWSDPNDLLTWYLAGEFQNWQTDPNGTSNGICVENQLVKNATTWNWLGLFENPERAHDKYAVNPRVIRALLEEN